MLLLSMMLLAAGQDGDQVQSAVSNYRTLTRADVPCERPRASDEIIVCGAREADKYRVPFVSAGSTRDSVPTRTSYLTKDFGAAECGQGAFMVRCGGVGVSMTFGFDGSATVKRELAH